MMFIRLTCFAALITFALLASLAASADLDAHHSEIAAYAKATEQGLSDEEMAKYDEAFHDPLRHLVGVVGVGLGVLGYFLTKKCGITVKSATLKV